MASAAAPVRRLDVTAYRVPTEGGPESDGTLVWDATTLVLVEIEAADHTGIGYTYADTATAVLIRDMLAKVVVGRDVVDHGSIWSDLVAAIRNLGRDGITSMAISAIDIALWDLRGKLSSRPVIDLLGAARTSVPVYGSGGFTSYDLPQLCRQLSGWVDSGIPRVKMKIGRDAQADVKRVAAARKAIGDHAELFVDANGGYLVKEALEQAERFAESRVVWYEEPVYHQNLAGLAAVRDRAPAMMSVTAGEYGYGLYHFTGMLPAKAVDILQADATRCGGFNRISRRRRPLPVGARSAFDALRTVSAPARCSGGARARAHGVFLRSRAYRTHVFRRPDGTPCGRARPRSFATGHRLGLSP